MPYGMQISTRMQHFIREEWSSVGVEGRGCLIVALGLQVEIRECVGVKVAVTDDGNLYFAETFLSSVNIVNKSLLLIAIKYNNYSSTCLFSRV